jgi:hypothetical protein
VKLPPPPLEHLFPPGLPPAERWCKGKIPPCNEWALFGVMATERCWMTPCPCCGFGWCALLPHPDDAFEYQLAAELGCTYGAGCAPAAITACLGWYRGEPSDRANLQAAWNQADPDTRSDFLDDLLREPAE